MPALEVKDLWSSKYFALSVVKQFSSPPSILVVLSSGGFLAVLCMIHLSLCVSGKCYCTFSLDDDVNAQ